MSVLRESKRLPQTPDSSDNEHTEDESTPVASLQPPVRSLSRSSGSSRSEGSKKRSTLQSPVQSALNKGRVASDNSGDSDSRSSKSSRRLTTLNPVRARSRSPSPVQGNSGNHVGVRGQAALDNNGDSDSRSSKSSRRLTALNPVRVRSRSPSPIQGYSGNHVGVRGQGALDNSGDSDSRSSSSSRRSAALHPARIRSRSPSPVRGNWGNRVGARGGAASGSDDSGDSEDDARSSNSSSGDGRVQRHAARRAARQRRLAEGGLNVGERPTPGRLRNPSKYTDKSLHTNLDRSPAIGNARRRMADGMPRQINAVCTNRLGKVRMCNRLLTPMNFRRFYIRLDLKIPRNLLMAFTLDVSEKRLRTLHATDVTTYYYNAARYLRTSISSADDELLNSDLAVRWLMNAIQIFDGLHLCTGPMTMSEAIDEKYSPDLDLRPGNLGAMIRRTLPDNGDHTRDEALLSLKNLADVIKPTDIRIWGIDDDELNLDPKIPRYNPNVFLGEARTNEVRVYPLAEKKSYIHDID